MRKIILISICFLVIATVYPQGRIGIGISKAQTNLDIIKSIRVGGITPNSAYIGFDSLNGQLKLNNSNIFISGNQAIMQHSASAEGLFYNNSQLEYRYQDGTVRFFTNWQTGNGYFYGNLGLGNSTPLAPVHMPTVLGPKIILWGEGNDYNYGFGVLSHRLEIHNDGGPQDNPSSIVFGYGSSNNFVENMRIVSTGVVGIGISDPQAALDVQKIPGIPTANFNGTQHISHFNFGANEHTYLRGGKDNAKLILNDVAGKPVGIGVEPELGVGVLDVGGRMLIRSGGSLATSAGMWFNKADNSGPAAFLGMENDNYVGFYGTGAGWNFLMNTQTGALKINGNEGSPGKVLQSNGSNAAPGWVSPTNGLYNNTIMLTSNSQIVVSPYDVVNIPGLSYTFTATGYGYFVVYYNIRAFVSYPCAGVAFSPTSLGIQLSGGREAPQTNYHALNICGREAQVSGVFTGTIGPAGSYTIRLSGYNPNQFDGVYFSCACPFTNAMIIQIYYL